MREHRLQLLQAQKLNETAAAAATKDDKGGQNAAANNNNPTSGGTNPADVEERKEGAE